MSISRKTRESVRLRANCTCEFCGISETDAGGELTIDHFQPTKKGGTDAPDNLVYCCPRCNQYKLDYFPHSATEPGLWNPRTAAFHDHFFEDDDGSLRPLTETGQFTILRMRLNRPQLIEFRLRKKRALAESLLLAQVQEQTELLKKLNESLTKRLVEQADLLKTQKGLLKMLIERFDR